MKPEKLLALLLTVMLIAAFSACGSQSTTASAPAANPSVAGGGADTPAVSPATPPSEPDTSPNDEPQAPMSTDPADYWISDSEFDMIGFCTAHGFDGHNIIEKGEYDVLSLRYISEVDGTSRIARSVAVGDYGHWIQIWNYDWPNMTASLFNGNVTGVDLGPNKITYTGTEVTQYETMMDFIIYVIPRVADTTIADPMADVQHPHSIAKFKIETTDVSPFWAIASTSYEVEHVDQ